MKTIPSLRDRVKQIDPRDFYSNAIQRYKPRGRYASGLCPFHEDHVSSFSANLETGAYKCFACGVRGQDIIAFQQARYDLGFRAALDNLAAEWGCA